MNQHAALCDRIAAGAELGEADQRALLDALDRLAALDRERGEIRAILDRTAQQPPAAANDDPTPSPGTDPAGWYRAYVEREAAAGRQPSREQDHTAMLAAGFEVSRRDARELRRRYALPSWQEPGRPRRAEK
jgi:hypothetical protein